MRVRAGELSCLCAILSSSACEDGAGTPDAAGGPGDAASVDARVERVEERIDDTEADAPRVVECQPGSQQACRGDDACWGHRNCNDQYKLGDCICETGAGGAAGSDAPSE